MDWKLDNVCLGKLRTDLKQTRPNQYENLLKKNRFRIMGNLTYSSCPIFRPRAKIAHMKFHIQSIKMSHKGMTSPVGGVFDCRLG